MRVVLVFTFSMWIEHPEKGVKDSETFRHHGIRVVYSIEEEGDRGHDGFP